MFISTIFNNIVIPSGFVSRVYIVHQRYFDFRTSTLLYSGYPILKIKRGLLRLFVFATVQPYQWGKPTNYAFTQRHVKKNRGY